MNKIQKIELLRFRGIHDIPAWQLIDDAIEQSGGSPNIKEMTVINERAMKQ